MGGQEKSSLPLYGAQPRDHYASFIMIKRAPPKNKQQAQKVWRRIHLRDWREYRGLSTEALAEKAGVSAGLISIIENRKSAGSPESLEKLAKALQVTVGELIDVKPDPDRRGAVMRFWVSDADREHVQRLVTAITTQSK